MNTSPDSALAILDSMAPYEKSLSLGNLRRWQLLRLMAQNKCDTLFRSYSLQLELVKYYDSHGTSNDCMTAHYLLGRAYSDMGEYPLALQSFLDALACADTTSMDCDFTNYFRISYTNLMSKYKQACYEAETLRKDKGEALKEKENEIGQLKAKLDKMHVLYESLSPKKKKTVLAQSDIVKKFKDLATVHFPKLLPSNKDWKLLLETIENTNPSLYESITVSNSLSLQEINTCLLTVLNFTNSELIILLDTSKQRVTNLKASANYKLFGERNSKTLSSNLKEL